MQTSEMGILQVISQATHLRIFQILLIFCISYLVIMIF